MIIIDKNGTNFINSNHVACGWVYGNKVSIQAVDRYIMHFGEFDNEDEARAELRALANAIGNEVAVYQVGSIDFPEEE